MNPKEPRTDEELAAMGPFKSFREFYEEIGELERFKRVFATAMTAAGVERIDAVVEDDDEV